MKFYTVYKTTHVPSGRFYIGRHVTDKLNDGYYGSGKIIKDYLKTHALAEFDREILFHAFDIESMKKVEAELITEHYDHPSCINVGTFIDSLPVMSTEGRTALSAYRKTCKMKDELKAQISAKLKGKKLSTSAIANHVLSWTPARKQERSQKYSNSGNPRAKRWVINFEDGRPQVEVVSLKTWCKDNNVKYTSLLASRTTQSYYNGMKLHHV